MSLKKKTAPQRREFTKDFKLKVLAELDGGLGMAQVARKYQVHPNTIRNWRKQARKYKDRAFAGRFDPARALQTPRSIRDSLGPQPRVITDDIWAKLLWAGLNLEAADLPQTPNKGYFYPLEMIRALVIVWLFAGLRNDEIRRLRVGCIRWQSGRAAATGDGLAPAKEAVCLLDVPINKTGTAFTKAVDRVVGEAVMT